MPHPRRNQRPHHHPDNRPERREHLFPEVFPEDETSARRTLRIRPRSHRQPHSRPHPEPDQRIPRPMPLPLQCDLLPPSPGSTTPARQSAHHRQHSQTRPESCVRRSAEPGSPPPPRSASQHPNSPPPEPSPQAQALKSAAAIPDRIEPSREAYHLKRHPVPAAALSPRPRGIFKKIPAATRSTSWTKMRRQPPWLCPSRNGITAAQDARFPLPLASSAFEPPTRLSFDLISIRPAAPGDSRFLVRPLQQGHFHRYRQRVEAGDDVLVLRRSRNPGSSEVQRGWPPHAQVIEARTDDGAFHSVVETRHMLQNLLADRFSPCASIAQPNSALPTSLKFPRKRRTQVQSAGARSLERAHHR